MFGSIVVADMLGPASGPIQVDVGRADGSGMAPLNAGERRLPTPGMVGQVERILLSGACSIPGQTSKRFDITVPYAVLVEPDGSGQAAPRWFASQLYIQE
ncbi:MAG TPA: hypothetical protein VEA61_05155 [Allosphingosinicella sp.]|nr:hypothetical protein [Allosphingosinicella sp.]